MIVQYILMRTDLDSLNPGKMAAQACHAANLSVKRMSDFFPEELSRWEEDRNFGTTIVLDAIDERTIIETVTALECMPIMNGLLVTGLLKDPTYPIRDGKVVHYVPLITCGWAFVETDTKAHEYMKKFSLHP